MLLYSFFQLFVLLLVKIHVVDVVLYQELGRPVPDLRWEGRVLQQIFRNLQIFLLQLSQNLPVVLDSLSLQLLPEHFIFHLEMINNLIFENMVGFCVFHLEPKVSFRLVDHFRLVFGDSLRKVFHDRVVVFVLLGNDQLISKVFVILFVLPDFLFQDGILFFGMLELLVFGFELEFKSWEFFIQSFCGLFGLGLFLSESCINLFVLDDLWLLIGQFLVEFFHLDFELPFRCLRLLQLHFHLVIFLLGGPYFLF